MIPYLSPAGLKIFAHRGSTEGGAVENTLESFRFALDSGVTYLETDVQATKDGVAVLFHDDTLERIAGLKAQVSDFSFAQLSEITLGSRSHIPSLKEALERFPKAKWNLDLKSHGAIAPTVQALMETKSFERVLVSSFSKRRRISALRLLPKIATSADAITIVKLWVSHKTGIQSLFRRLLTGIDALQIPIRFGPMRLDRPDFMKAVNGCGVELHYWTVNDFDEAKRLVDLGAKGIVTDKSKMMLERFNRSERGK